MNKDSSPRVVQREKFKDSFEIKDYFKWTDKQKRFIDISLHKDTQIVICRAPSGVGKTLLSLYCSLVLLKEKKIGEIYYLRLPAESCSKSIGFLAGEKESKMSVYASPLNDHLHELLDKQTIDKLTKEDRIKVDSIGFIKGRTFHNCSCICDESEDMTTQEISLALTRLGRFSKIFLIGDDRQTNVKNSGFNTVFKLFNNEEAKLNGIYTFEFDSSDCLRNGIMKFILDKFESLFN